LEALAKKMWCQDGDEEKEREREKEKARCKRLQDIVQRFTE
jgi:hypothetical protein